MADRIQIINRTRRVRDARWQYMMPGLQRQISQDFAPLWGADATLVFVGKHDKPNDTDWKLWLLDTSDDPGALGYHEDDTGVPEGKIFVEDDMRYGAEITVTVSHELLEMLADPLATKVAPIIDGRRYAIEVCDAVEADQFGYILDGIRVSDFVLPAYFVLPNPAGVTAIDFQRHLSDLVPAMMPGGYLLYQDASGNWVSTMRRYDDGTLSVRAIRSAGRTARRAAVRP